MTPRAGGRSPIVKCSCCIEVTDPAELAALLVWLHDAPPRAQWDAAITLTVEHRAACALAEMLGEIAADMWLAGTLDLPLTRDGAREIVD